MYQICISGAAEGDSVIVGKKLAEDAGIALARSGHALLSGATSGLPHLAAVAYKRAGGSMSVGISPASSKVEHVMKYRLPTKPYDFIIYTGMHYVGRDSFLVNSADAVISIGGRLGTLHEALIALESHTPIGFLEGAGGTGEHIQEIIEAAHEVTHDVIYDEDAKSILVRLIKILDEQHKQYKDLYD